MSSAYPTNSVAHRDCCIGVSFPLVALEKFPDWKKKPARLIEVQKALAEIQGLLEVGAFTAGERRDMQAPCEAAADAIERLQAELDTVTAERDRYKAERENPQPLTLEELRRMDGEVVCIPESEEYFGGMGIVSVSQERVVDVGDPKFGYWAFREYGEGWRAYRSQRNPLIPTVERRKESDRE